MEKRAEWLSETGRSEDDVLEDYRGVEYIYVENEMDEGEAEESYRRVELPLKLQKHYTPF